jgi:hypothetical protein
MGTVTGWSTPRRVALRRRAPRLPRRTEACAPRRPLPRVHRPEATRPEGMGVAPTARRTCNVVPAGAVCATGGRGAGRL